MTVKFLRDTLNALDETWDDAPVEYVDKVEVIKSDDEDLLARADQPLSVAVKDDENKEILLFSAEEFQKFLSYHESL